MKFLKPLLYYLNTFSNSFNYNSKHKTLKLYHESFLFKLFRTNFFLSVLTFLFLIILPADLLPQSWDFLGGPEGKVSNDIMFTKSGRLICSTYEGISFSDDFGNSWSYSNSSKYYRGFFNLSQRINGDLMAITSNGIAVSYDQGENWNLIYEIYALNDYGAHICESPKDSSLYYAADKKLFKSTDNGYNWQVILNSNEIIYSYAIDDSGRIYLGGINGKVLISVNNGFSFYSFNLGYLGYDFSGAIVGNIMTSHSGGLYFDVNYFDSKVLIHYENNTTYRAGTTEWFGVILAVTPENDMVYTSGACLFLYNHLTQESNWFSCPYFIKDQFARKIVIYNNHWIADFYSEGLHHSSDSGKNWKEITSGRGYKYCISLEITNGGKIFVGSFNTAFWGSLYQSLNDGKTWSRKDPFTLDSYFIDISKLANGGLIASGSYGAFTSDKDGSFWRKSSGLNMVSSQYVSKKGVVFAGNEYHGIYKSTNNGDSWIQSNNNLPENYIYGIGEGSNNRIFASIGSNDSYFTDDDGASWIKIVSAELNYQTAYCFTQYNDTVYAGTNYGVIYSPDNGITWQRFTSLSQSVHKILIAPNGDLITSTSNNGIYIYARDQKLWKPFNQGMETRDITDLTFDKYYRLFAVSDSGLFRSNYYISNSLSLSPRNNSSLSSHNINFNWTAHPYAISYHLQIATDSTFNNLIVDDIEVKDTFKLVESLHYLTTYYWRVKVNLETDSYFSNVYKFNTLSPQSFVLRQNYPNPFNSSTNIVFDIPIKSKITIKVFNVLGELIDIIADKEFEPGTHNYIWNAQNLSSGVYIIILETSGLFATNKAILLK